jgi:hypothetical protein
MFKGEEQNADSSGKWKDIPKRKQKRPIHIPCREIWVSCLCGLMNLTKQPLGQPNYRH